MASHYNIHMELFESDNYTEQQSHASLQAKQTSCISNRRRNIQPKYRTMAFIIGDEVLHELHCTESYTYGLTAV